MHLWWKILPRPFHRHWIDLSPIACIALQADRPRGCMNVSFSFPILLCRMSFPFCFVRLAFSPWLFPPLHSPLFLTRAMSFIFHGTVSRPSLVLVGEQTTAADGNTCSAKALYLGVHLVSSHQGLSRCLPGWSCSSGWNPSTLSPQDVAGTLGRTEDVCRRGSTSVCEKDPIPTSQSEVGPPSQRTPCRPTRNEENRPICRTERSRTRIGPFAPEGEIPRRFHRPIPSRFVPAPTW